MPGRLDRGGDEGSELDFLSDQEMFPGNPTSELQSWNPKAGQGPQYLPIITTLH